MTDTTPGGWPDKPGVPMNPERDGWHWVRGRAPNEEPYPMHWSCHPAGFRWWSDIQWRECAAAQHWSYLGPCHTPAEVAAQVEAARREGAAKEAGE
jgi:hypothetical protein